jgi:hypothetical protein
LGIPSAELFDLKNHDGKLLITLKSKVLDVKGFPITIGAHEDVVSRVSEALGTAKRL